nr:B542 [uncultured bacterium]
MHSQIFAASPRQRGVSTLVVAIVLLIAATFLTFFAAKVGMQEQRMSANEYRHKEAFATAEAGLDRAKAYLAANRQGFSGWGWTACAGTETTPPCGDGTDNLFGTAWSWVNVYTLSSGAALSGLTWDSADGPFILTQTAPAAIVPGTSFQPITLVAQASSADGTGRAVVRQSMSRYMIAQPGPVPPLMAPTVPLGGNFTVVGNPNHDLDISEVNLSNCDDLTGSGQMLSIWSKDTLATSGTWQTCGFGSFRDGPSPTDTRCIGPDIVDPATGNTPTWNQCVCQVNAAEKSPYSGNDVGVNDDIVDDDPNFPGDIFAYVFGRSKAAVKASAASAGNVIPDCSGLNASSTGLFWVTGDCNLSNNQVIGSRFAPAIVVFEQDASFQGTSHFWGLMVGADMERSCTGGSGEPYYVGGTCTSASPNTADIQGTFTLHGAMIVEGTVDGTGTYNAVYDPCVFAAIGEGTDFDQYGPIAGSWNDSIR